ncbi:thiol peroxidase [Enterovibrio paralichthyis]|uniref:thiol peroxidase n=1 Tax=Enterovibrio paralichthyis TaxID=2853805 RepID=UPI001C4658CA|nr:thiol peroxidase [Enterovibrio paralichthyis]MBV7300558.1 thiol peroxidase [Enterovibrio paralichthyis]
MSQTHFQGEPVPLVGNLPKVGDHAPDFSLTKADLSDVSLADFRGRKLVLNIFPSIDTPTCAASTRAFNEKAGLLPNTQVVCVSADLPFAASRFCEVEGLKNVMHASTFRDPSFLRDYGVAIAEGPLVGLAARAVVGIDEDGVVLHVELVNELTNEPDYNAVIAELAR